MDVAILIEVASCFGDGGAGVEGIDLHEGDIGIGLVLRPDHGQPLDIRLEIYGDVDVGIGDRAVDCQVSTVEDHNGLGCAPQQEDENEAVCYLSMHCYDIYFIIPQKECSR